MSFSKEWDAAYAANTHNSIWPWSDLVSYVMCYARPASNNFTALELGCGAGANIPFLKSLGVKYYGIEGSATIVERLRKRFPEYAGTIVTGDFTKDIPFNVKFDLVVDRGSSTHNSTESIENSIRLIYDKMKPGSKFIGIDWFSTTHSDYRSGKNGGDKNTRMDFKKGQFVGVGKVHFSNEKHLRRLFSDFRIDMMEHKSIKRTFPKDNNDLATWNFVAVKVK